MIAPTAQRQPGPKTVRVKNAPDKVLMMPDTIPAEERIRDRANELYEKPRS